MTQAEIYFYSKVKFMDAKYAKFSKKSFRGKEAIYAEPICEGVNLQGYWWPEDLEKTLKEIRSKDVRCRTPYEKDLLNTAYEFFEKYSCDFDAFATWEVYERFINTLSDDFFGRD